MRRFTYVVLAVLTAASLGCGGSSSSNSSSGPNLTGNWQFSVTSSANGSTDSGTVSITQNSTSVSGTVNFNDDPCATTAPLAGSIRGSSLNFQLTEGSQTAELTGTVNSSFTAMSGTYTTPSGGCTNGDFGSWAASKS